MRFGGCGTCLGGTSEALRATGTDDIALEPPNEALQYAQQLGRETVQSSAMDCDETSEVEAQRESPKTLQIADLDEGMRVSAKVPPQRLEP